MLANLSEEAIFHAALAIAAAEERCAYLDAACGEPELRRRVEALLRRCAESRGPLDRPVASLAATADEPLAEGAGSVLGPYKLLEQIGEGGFGIVFMAEQQEPIRRKVAVKVLKPGMDSKQVIARFEAERQALALMDHPNIAKILDAGTTENPKSEKRNPKQPQSPKSQIPNEVAEDVSDKDVSDFDIRASSFGSGRPYFVMDLVKGLPITEYSDQNQLTPRERLELFVHVVQAVQHAHQKGIIHRDLKPSNVLVTLHDGTPLAKIIDFGIAKALGQPLTDKTLFTGFAQMMGTPLYMSPEQAALSNVDVDTRSDIYSLGVLLYELLTGTTPFDRERLSNAGYDEMRRIIREEEPPRPSTRMSTLGQAASTISSQRKSDPKRLSLLFRGELDWIVMKCLEKDRNRRYETASALAADVHRYLHDEPVEACPPSAMYRFRKFARRNKAGLTVASGAIVTLIMAVAGLTAGIFAVERERGRTERAYVKLSEEQTKTEAALTRAVNAEGLARDEEKKAKAQAAKYLAGISFIQRKLLATARPKGLEGGLGPQVTIREALQAVEPKIAEILRDQPLVEADIRDTFGGTYRYLGEPMQAIPQFERAMVLLQANLGADHEDTLTAMSNLAGAYEEAGRVQQALALHEQAFKKAEEKLAPEHPARLGAMHGLAGAYSRAGKFDLALALYQTALDKLKETLGPDDQRTLHCLHNLGSTYLRAGKPQLALPRFQEVVKRREAKFGRDHIETLLSRSCLADTYADLGNLASALPLLEQTLGECKVSYGPDHPITLRMMNNLAMTYQRAGRLDKAIPLLEETLEKKIKHGPDHPDTLRGMNNLALAYQLAGQPQKAAPMFEKALARRIAIIGPKHPDTLNVKRNLAFCYDEMREWEKAEPLFRELVVLWREKAGADSPQRHEHLAELGLNLLRQKKYAEAELLLRESLAMREKKAPDAWTTFDTKSQLGGSLLGQKKYAEAEPLLLEGCHGLQRHAAKIPKKARDQVTDAMERMIQLYDGLGKKDKAEEWQRKVQAEQKQGR